MKTSKRLLSLFLALVMVITTCSVGMTAFAADDENAVFTYVDDEGKAIELTYDGIENLVNTYAPVLINLLGDKLAGIGVNVDEVTASKTPIYELIAQISPWLMGLLSGSGSKKAILDNKKNILNNAFGSYIPLDDTYYGYLDDTSGNSGAMNFWCLYAFCYNHRSAGGDVGKYCNETYEKLSTLLNAYSNARSDFEGELDDLKNKILALFGMDEGTSIGNPDNALSAIVSDAIPHSIIPHSMDNIGSAVSVDGKTLEEISNQMGSSHVYDGVDYSPLFDYYETMLRYVGVLAEDETLSFKELAYNISSNNYTISHALTVKYATSNGKNFEVSSVYGDITYTPGCDYKETLFQSSTMSEMYKNLIAACYGIPFEKYIEENKAHFGDGFSPETTEGILTYMNYFVQNKYSIVSNLTADDLEDFYEFYMDYAVALGIDKFSGNTSFQYDIDHMTEAAYIDSMRQFLVTAGFFESTDAVDEETARLSITEDDLDLIKSILEMPNIVASGVGPFFKEVYKSDLSPFAQLYLANNFTDSNSAEIQREFMAWEPGQPYTGHIAEIFDNANSYAGAYYWITYGKGDPVEGQHEYSKFEDTLIEYLEYEYFLKGKLSESSYNWNEYRPDSDDTAINIVNTKINDYVEQCLAPDAKVGDIDLDSLLQTSIDLQSALKDIYLNFAEKPVDTIFKLVPLLVVLFDELLVPIVFNGPATENTNRDQYYGEGGFYTLLFGKGDGTGLIKGLTQADGSDVGIGQFGWDLNTILPSVLHWLIGDNSYNYTYYNVTDNGDGTLTYGENATGALGTKYDDEGNRTNKVPVLLNVYVADKFLADASIKDIANEGGREAVTELAAFALETIEEYVAEHGEDISFYTDAGNKTPANKGLNNIGVAFPKLIDAMGKKFNEKYSVDSDWSFGSFAQQKDKYDGFLYNAGLDKFKELATNGASATECIETFTDLFVNGWLNGLIDFLNDVTSDPNSRILSGIPIVADLLAALDAFGEKSVLTDVLNSFFLMSRDNADSLTFEERENGYVGLSKLSAYFLLINLEPLVKTIIEIVQGGIGKNSSEEPTTDNPTTDNSGENSGENSGNAFDIKSIVDKIPEINEDFKKINTKETNEAVDKIIASLDKILSSLLSNTYLNGYTVDELDGVLSGVITSLTNHFGKQLTNELLVLLMEYVDIINADSLIADYAPDRNTNSNGPVDAKKVYSEKNLSKLVTQTYVLIEKILDKVLAPVFPGDKNGFLTSAICGIVSPSAIVVHSNDSVDKDITKFVSWNDLNASKYATNLGYDFKAGDKSAFYDNLIDSLGVIPSLIGVLLGSTGLYDNLLVPIFSSICGTCGIKFAGALPKGAAGRDILYQIMNTVSLVLNKFLDAPVSTLLNLLRGLFKVLEDSVIRNIIQEEIRLVFDHIDGLADLLGEDITNLAPSLAKRIRDLKTTIDDVLGYALPEKDVLNTLILLLVTLLGDADTLPVIRNIMSYLNWSKLANASNSEMVLYLYTAAIDIVLSNEILSMLLGEYTSLLQMLQKLDAVDVFHMINDILVITQNPTEIYWMFNEYVSKAAGMFAYPAGITRSEADDAVDALDNLVANVFPLLQSLDVLDQGSLDELVSGLLYKNELLTTIATAVYGGIENAAKGKFNFTPAQFADYLMDSSYGKTYSSAADTLRKCASWNDVKTVNWGFTDGSAKAQQGFINGLAALCRPINDVLAVLLAGGGLELISTIKGVVKDLELGFNNNTDKEADIKYSITLKDGVLNIFFTNNKAKDAQPNKVQINILDFLNSIGEARIYGSNGYESAVIPIFEALMVDNVKTYSQYLNDYEKAKDNVVLDVLNPLFGFVNDVLDAPFDTISAALPNVAYFIANNGLEKAVSNLLAPVTEVLAGALSDNGLDFNTLVNEIVKIAANGKDLNALLGGLLGMDVKVNLNDLTTLNIKDIVIPLVNSLLKNYNITLPAFKWETIASHGTQTSFISAGRTNNGGRDGIRIIANQGETLVAVLRYIADALITNATEIEKLICSIDSVAKNKTIVNILSSIFTQLGMAHKDQIVQAVFYLLNQNPQNAFFDYRGFTYKNYEFTYPTTVDIDFLTVLGPMLDGLITGLADLPSLVGGLLYKDDIISSIATGLYGAVEGVKINDSLNLTQLLAQTDIDFSTENVAKLLTDKNYGQSYANAAKVIKSAGSWSKVDKAKLTWGVTDRNSFVHALCAVLRPIYGVLDVLLNDGSLGLFKLIYLPGSDGYTSAIVPLMEAFGLYNVKTQYQYRQDISKQYDAILLDILNPLLDKVEDILNAPIETLADMLPNLALFLANNGLLQLIDNLLLPINALLDSLKPIVDVNDLLKTLGLDIDKTIAGLGLGVSNFHFDIYNLSETLKPLIGADNIVGLINSVLKLIKISGTPLGIELMPIDWYQLASHGTVITNEASQAATFGARVYVQSDGAEVLVAVLRYLIDTINYKGNLDTISGLIGGLLGNANDTVSSVVSQVLGMISGESDQVISDLLGLLETLA